MMKKCLTSIVFIFMATVFYAQNPVGKWKMISHISEYEGQKIDSQAALLKQRPCASKIIYEINADATYRLNAKNSGCDEKYKNIQEKLYAQSVWTLKGKLITIGHKKAPDVGQTYSISFSGDKMIWKGTQGQGIVTFQKL